MSATKRKQKRRLSRAQRKPSMYVYETKKKNIEYIEIVATEEGIKLQTKRPNLAANKRRFYKQSFRN